MSQADDEREEHDDNPNASESERSSNYSSEEKDRDGGDKDGDGKDTDDADDEKKGKKPSPLSKPWVRALLVVIALVVVVALIVYLIHYERTGKYLQSTNDAMIDANVVTVAPQVNGYVTRVFVDDNQGVRAGQPLVQIDPRDYEAQVAQYRAQVDVGLANADNYRAQIREQQATVAQAHQQYLSSLASARFQIGEARRYAPLAATGAETKEKAAQYRSQADAYTHTAAADRANMVSAQRKIGALQAQVRQSLAQARSAQAQADAAEVNESLTLIRATIDGRVGDNMVHAGQYVSSGTKMMSLVPIENLYITANFKETQLGIMRPGQPATITVDALPGVQLHGHVVSGSPGTGAQFSLIPPQNASGNFTKIVQRVPVRIAIDAGPEARKVLVPGMSVNVTVDTVGARESMARIKDQEKQRQDQARHDQDRRDQQVRRQNQ